MTDPQTQTTPADDGVSYWGIAIYDEIMGDIEPELVSAAIETLTEKYAEETEEQAAVRAERYNSAYARFDAALAERKKTWNDTMHTLKHRAFASLEKDDHEKEMTEGMAVLDRQLSSM